jgi:hypothetical protein
MLRRVPTPIFSAISLPHFSHLWCLSLPNQLLSVPKSNHDTSDTDLTVVRPEHRMLFSSLESDAPILQNSVLARHVNWKIIKIVKNYKNIFWAGIYMF